MTFTLGSTRRVFAEKKKKKKERKKEKKKEKKCYWNVSKTMPRKHLRDGVERIWDFSSVYYRVELNRLTLRFDERRRREEDQRGKVDFTGLTLLCLEG